MGRVLAVGAALVVTLWAGLQVVQQQALADVDRIAADDAGDRARAERLLDRAGWLNPDERVALTRAGLAFGAGDAAGAIETVLAVTRREPDNLQAWVQLAFIAAEREPALERRAFREGRRLSPAVSP